MNVFLFLGCSFTWGEGLQYYSELPSVIFHSHHTFDIRELTYPQYQFISKNRFARIVADNFNGIEIVNSENGGNHKVMIDSLAKPFEFLVSKELAFSDSMNYRKESFHHKNEISHIVIQFTDVYRDSFDSMGALKEWGRQEQHKYCIEKGISSEDFEKDAIRYILRLFKKELEEYIKMDVKITFFLWQDKFWLDVFNEPEFQLFKDNLLPIKYNGLTYFSINDLTNRGNKFTIQSDFCEKMKKQCGDVHLNIEGHKIIAKSIIEKFSN